MKTADPSLAPASALSRLETESVFASGDMIAKFAKDDKTFHLTLSRETGERVEAQVPAKAVQLLGSILKEMSMGNSVALIPDRIELSTIQAAERMRVSRPYLVKLLDAGKIPFRVVGTHRRVLNEDLMKYIEEEKTLRKAALIDLVAEQERLGLYE